MLPVPVVPRVADGLVDHDAALLALAVAEVGRLALLVEDRVALLDPLGDGDGHGVLLALLALRHLLLAGHVHRDRLADLFEGGENGKKVYVGCCLLQKTK